MDNAGSGGGGGGDAGANRNVHTGKKTLHFGALVYLCFENEKNEEFITTAEGFTKNKIRLKQANAIERDGSFTSGLFKIFPPFYDSEYLKTKQVSEQKKQEKQEKHKSFNRRAARQEIPKQIKLMEEEAALNYDQYEKLKGTPVLYGQTIQLLHHNSNKYLQFDQKSVSDFESDNLKVSLSEEYSEETQFRILPCFSYQQESQGLIFDQDTIYIVSTIDSRNSVGEPYLHASKDIVESQTSTNTHNGTAEPSSKIIIQQKKKKEMNVSTDKRSQWKIKIFCNYTDEKSGMLSVCDIVWINYSEKDLNLLVQKISDTKKQEKYVLKFEDCDSTEKYKKFVGNSNGMFVVESPNMQQGGLVEWESKYRLRHLTTNQYLSIVVMGTSEVVQDDRCLILQPDPNLASLFRFELIYSTLVSRNRNNLTKYLQKDSYFRMSVKVQSQSGKSIGNEEDEVFWLKTADSEEFRENIRDYLDGPSLSSNEKQIFPAFSAVKKEENVFKLNKASSNEVRMTEFLLSCRKTIKKTFSYLDPQYISNIDQGKFQQKYKKFLVMVGRLDRCLMDLNRFCHNKLRAYLYIDQEYGAINSFIQNVLREQLFIELLVSLLALSFPRVENLNEIKKFEEQKSRKMKQDNQIEGGRFVSLDNNSAFNQEIQEEFVQKKKRVANFIYKLLASICQSNRKNKERTSQYLPLFAMQSKYIPGCMDCIFSVIQDYGDLLQNQLQTDAFEHNPSFDQKSNKKQNSVVRKFYTLPTDISRINKKYEKNYEVVTNQLKTNPQQFQLKERWDMFEFFCYQLIETNDFTTKRQLLKFFGFASTDKGDGVNENQELIYKYLIPENEEFMYDKEYLIRIKSEGPELLVTHEQRKLVDVVKKQNFAASKKRMTFEVDQQKKSDDDILEFIKDQLQFYTSMCNKRNNTWKKFVDKSCKFESLAETIVEEKITFDIRAIICSLLNKLYVDQEPKRMKYFPELCKVLSVGDISKWNEDRREDNEENLEDKPIKDKLIAYIKVKAKLIDTISDEIKLQKSTGTAQNSEQEANLMKIQSKSNDVYNHLTYEIIKMLRLLTDFGKYNIHNDVSEFAKLRDKFNIQSGEFFEILQNIMTIFEFDKTFPEARKTLLKQRHEEKLAAQRQFQEQSAKTLMTIFNFTKDIIGFSSEEEDPEKKKKKKAQNYDIVSDDINIQDSFLKQTDVLRKILHRFFSDNQDDIEFKIKQEICEILKQFLNYKHDYMLNRLKYQFSYLVTDKLNTIQKLKEAGSNEAQISIALKEFKDTIQENIDCFIPSVLLTGTEIDKNQDYSKQFMSQSFQFPQTSNFANFSPLAFVGQKSSKEAKDGEIININKVLGFQILPSLVLLFCFTQNYQMEEKLLSIMTRFYNQRQEFATLASQLVILFDDDNQKVLEYTKSIISLRLDKNVNESETWTKQLEEKENMKILRQTIKDIQFFADILRVGTSPQCSNEHDLLNEQKKGTKQFFVVGRNDNSNEDSKFFDGMNGGDGKYNSQFEEMGEMDEIRQNIFYHNKVHELAVNLIKDSIYLLEDLENKKNSSLDQKDSGESANKNKKIYNAMRTLFKTCMAFLRNFAYKNTVNQNLLSEYLEKLHKALPHDIGLMELYWEIFRDNKRICLDFQERISEDFINLIQKNGRQARYLEFFQIIQKVNNEYLIQNQKYVLNCFLNETQRRTLMYLTNSEKLEFSFEQVHENDEPYAYHAKLIEVLTMTTTGKEGMYMSEQKLRSQITLRYAFELLSAPDSLTIITDAISEQDQSIREEDEQQSGQEILSGEMLIKQEKQRLRVDEVVEENVEEESKGQLEESIDIENYKRPQGQVLSRFTTQLYPQPPKYDSERIRLLKRPLLDYLFFTFLESEKVSDEFNKYITNFIEYIRVETVRVNHSTSFQDSYYEYLNSLFIMLCSYKKAFANSLNSGGLKSIDASSSGAANDTGKGTEAQNMNKQLERLTQAILKKPLLFLKNELFSDARRQQTTRISMETNELYKQRWKIFRSLVEGNRTKAVRIEEEENDKRLAFEKKNSSFSSSFFMRKKTDKKAPIIVKKEKENLASNLFDQLNVFGIGKKETLEIDPDCALFQGFQKQEIMWQRLWEVFLEQFLNSSYLKTQINTEHTIFAQALEKIEVIFKENSAVNEIINKNEIFKKLIAFLSKSYKETSEVDTFKLILNCLGNFIQPPKAAEDDDELSDAQKEAEQEQMESNQNFINQQNGTYALLSLLSDHGSHVNDTVFGDLINFGIRLLEEGNNDVQKSVYSYFMNFTSSEVFFKRIHTILSDEIVRLKRGILDTSQEGLYYFQQQEDIVYSILRLLQLFAEGHNLDLQKYMRLQTQNYHNFDLIEVIIELLNNYFKKKCVRYIKNMTQCLDTLTEYIQGPCKENQHALIQDNFLDLASSLLGIDEIIDEINLEIKKEKLEKQKDDSDDDQQQQNANNRIADDKIKSGGQGAFVGMDDNSANTTNSDDELLPRWEISKLKYKCSITLISLLEARSKEDDIVPRMMKTLNIDIIRRNITDIYQQFVEIGNKEYNSDLFDHFNLNPDDSDKVEHKNKCSFIIETGFNLFILLSTFKEVGKDEEEQVVKRKKKKDDEEDNFLLQNNIVTEVLQMVFKIIDGLKQFLEKSASQVGNLMKKQQKEDWNEKKIKVKNNREKMQDHALKFFQQHTVHIEVLRENDNQLEKTYFYLPYFCKDLDKDTKTNFNRNANRISVKAKVTSLVNTSEELIKKMKHNYQLHKWLEKIPLLLFMKEKIGLLRNLAFLLAIAINIMVLFSFEHVTDSDGNVSSVNQYTESPIRVLGIVLIVLSVIVVMYFLALNAPLLIMKAWAGPMKKSLFQYLIAFYQTFMNLLSDFYVLYYLIYGMTAVVGTIVSPFFFFFHLFDVLVRSPDLLNVVQAVWIPKKSILFTYFLFLVLMYVFTLFGYYWLDDSYPGDFCESTFVCLITAIDRSFKFDGGLGGYLNPTIESDSNGYFLVRFFFDNIYFILLMIIMINIVSGIIIDQFGEGRDELKEYNEDLMFKCFICGFSNEEIEKNSDQNQDFKSHIKEDHYMWNYLYYIAYLKDKAQTEYTGIESYVADKLEKKEITWFPTNRALCMNKNVSIKQNQEIFNSLQDITNTQEKIRQTLDSVNSTLDQFQVDYQGDLSLEKDQKEEH